MGKLLQRKKKLSFNNRNQEDEFINYYDKGN